MFRTSEKVMRGLAVRKQASELPGDEQQQFCLPLQGERRIVGGIGDTQRQAAKLFLHSIFRAQL